MNRVAIYARYSSDLQSDASIEDQIRICRERADREGWAVIGVYADHAVSGASMMRAEIQDLILDARARKFDIVIAEALDRLSRDQEDIAHIYKRLTFEGVRIITLSEGEVGKLHIGLKGTMNALFLEELARKTHRGLQGRVLAGKSAGGRAYGYNVVRKFDAVGEPIRGEREINETEAEVVRRIMRDYTLGKSPRKIAFELNAEGIPGPCGREWAASTINGHRSRGTGIVNNELYVGIQVWDRRKFMKDPTTGARAARMNSGTAVTRVEVPHLRIVDQELWDQVRAYQSGLDRALNPRDKRRPARVFSNMLKCGCCGGGMSIIAKDRYGCSTARNKGTCDNRLTILEREIENRVLSALSTRLMDPDLCEVFCQEYTQHLNRVRMEHNATRSRHAHDLEKVNREIAKVIQSIKDGIDATLIKDEANALQRRKEQLTAQLETSEDSPVLIHPNMAHRYKVQVQNLMGALNDPEHRDEAAQILRKLIDRIVFTPTEDKSALTIDLIGDLAGILLLADPKTAGKPSVTPAKLSPSRKAEIEQVKDVVGLAPKTKLPPISGGQVKMGAGVGFEPTTFRL